MSSLMSRVLVAVVGVPVLAWVVLWAPLSVMKWALALLAVIAALEMMQCVGLAGKEKRLNLLVAATGVMAFCTVFFQTEAMTAARYVYVVICAFGYAIIKGGEIKLVQVLASLFAGLVIPYSFASFLRIEDMGFHRAYLLLPFILSFACDTFAYIVGCTLGKHKLAPKVSPKKSIEGSVGGLAGNVLCGLLFAFVMDRSFGGSIGYGEMALLSLSCGVVAQVGDLSFSLIKREFGIKDYGHLFLAHGGVLDRFDSVLFVAPVIEMILQFVK